MIRLVFVLVVTLLSVTQQVSGDRFYITTSPNNPCPERFHATSGRNSCLTLQEYVNGLQHPSSNTVVLELEPGNHNLSSPFSISSNVTSVTLVAANSMATIHCVHYDALSFNAVEMVYISGVNFAKCLANKVESASVFTLEDYSFTTATLSLLNVTNATIARGSFQENGNVNTSLYTFRSSLLVQETDFTNNVGYRAGAIRSVESQLTVEQCAFTSNSNRIRNLNRWHFLCGGAIIAFDGGNRKLSIVNSTFTNNGVMHDLPDRGGAICVINQTITEISGSTFVSNHARTGGAIDIRNFRTLLIYMSRIEGNTATHGIGGAIHLDGSNTEVLIDQSRVENNSGGAVLIEGNVQVFNCTRSVFSNNDRSALEIKRIDDDVHDTAFISISQSLFANNNRPWNDKGRAAVDIYIRGSLSVLFEKNTFANNSGKYFGGAVRVYAPDSDAVTSFNVVENVFQNNTCDCKQSFSFMTSQCQGGGALNLNATGLDSFASITRNLFVGNKLVNQEYGIGVYYGKGGAVAARAQHIVINQSNFVTNEARLGGGAVYADAKSDLLISETHFTNNTVQGRGQGYRYREFSGGAVFVGFDVKATTIDTSNFSNNAALKCGALDFSWDRYHGTKNVNIFNSSFTNNNATTENGGAICTNGGHVSIFSSNFSHNSANRDAGALLITDNTPRPTTISGCVFDHNSAESNGGALNGFGPFVIKSSTFTSNFAGSKGGGIFLKSGQWAEVNNSAFSHNYAATEGGAIHLTSVGMEINNVTFSNNTAATSTAGGEIMKACKSVVILSPQVRGLLTVHTDLDYEENFCILYDTKGPAFQPNQTNDTHIPYVAHENLLIVSEPPDDSSCVANSTTEFDSCLTLQEYAVNGTSKVSSELLMKLAPGNHTISSSLNIRYKSSLTIVGDNANVGCSGRNTIISILQVHTVHISGVTFVGCDISIGSVDMLMQSGLKFLTSGVLRLSSITSATISRNAFIGRNGCCGTWPSQFIVADFVQRLLFTQCTFFKNWGGCIYSEDSRVTVEHSNFTQNTIYPTNERWGKGAAITATHWTLSEHFDGADSLNITNCTFVNHQAAIGGAVYVSGPDTPVWITQSRFSGNSAYLHDGGAVYIATGSSVWISDNIFESNRAHVTGGAVYCAAPRLTIGRNLFVGNTADAVDSVYIPGRTNVTYILNNTDVTTTVATETPTTNPPTEVTTLATTRPISTHSTSSSTEENPSVPAGPSTTITYPDTGPTARVSTSSATEPPTAFSSATAHTAKVSTSPISETTITYPATIPTVKVSTSPATETTKEPSTSIPTAITPSEANSSATEPPSSVSPLTLPTVKVSTSPASETAATYPDTIPTPRTPSETNSSATEPPSAVSSATTAPSETNPSTPEGVPTTAISSTDNATTTSSPVSEVRRTTADSPATTEVRSGSEANTMASTTPSPNSASKGESSQHKPRLVVIIPTVVVVVLVTLIAALVSVVLLFLCCFARRGPFHRRKRSGQSSILSKSGSYVELLQPEDNGQEGGGDDDQVEKL